MKKIKLKKTFHLNNWKEVEEVPEHIIIFNDEELWKDKKGVSYFK